MRIVTIILPQEFDLSRFFSCYFLAGRKLSIFYDFIFSAGTSKIVPGRSVRLERTLFTLASSSNDMDRFFNISPTVSFCFTTYGRNPICPGVWSDGIQISSHGCRWYKSTKRFSSRRTRTLVWCFLAIPYRVSPGSTTCTGPEQLFLLHILK